MGDIHKVLSGTKSVAKKTIVSIMSVLLVFTTIVVANTQQAKAESIWNGQDYVYAYKEPSSNAHKSVRTEVTYTEERGHTYANVKITYNPDSESWASYPYLWFTVPEVFQEPEFIIHNGTEYRSWRGDSPWAVRAAKRWVASKTGTNDRTGEEDSRASSFQGELEKMVDIKRGRYDDSVNNRPVLDALALYQQSIYITREAPFNGPKVISYKAKVEPNNKGYRTAVLAGLFKETAPTYNRHIGKITVIPTDPPPMNTVNEPVRPEITEVTNVDNLTQPEIETVKQKIEDANRELINNGTITGISVNNKGVATVTYKDNTRDSIASAELVRQTPPPPVPVIPPTGSSLVNVGEYKVRVPNDKIKVNNPYSLTQQEREAIKQKLMDLNEGAIDGRIHSVKFERVDGSGKVTRTVARNVDYSIGYNLNDTITHLAESGGDRQSVPINLFAEDANSSSNTQPAPISEDERRKAKEQIDALPNLSTEEKNTFKDRITNADTRDKINETVKAASDRDREIADAKLELEKAKAKGKEDINNLINLSTTDKERYANQINALTYPDNTKADVERIVANAKAENLAIAKQSAKESLADIEPTIFAKYENRIDSATTVEDLPAIVDAARLEDAKKKAKEQVERLELDPAKKREYINEIENAPDASTAYAALEKAKADAYKEEAHRKIDQIPGLSDEGKRGFKDKINEATNIDDINAVIFDAENKGKKRRNKA